MKLYRKKYRLIETYGTFFVDLVAVSIAYYVAMQLRMHLPFGPVIKEETIWLSMYAMCMLGCLVLNLLPNKYEGFFQRKSFLEMREVLQYNLLLFVFLTTCIYLFRLEEVANRLMLLYFAICNSFFCYLFRGIFKGITRSTYRKGKGSEKILIVTDLEHCYKVWENLKRDQGWSYEVVGTALIDSTSKFDDMKEQKTLGKKGVIGDSGFERIIAGRENLIEVARQMSIDIVFIYCDSDEKDLGNWMQSFALMGIRCYYCVQTTNFDIPCNGVGEFANFPVLCYNNLERDWRMSVIKRLTDIVGSVVGLIITAILFPFIAIAIKVEDPKGRILFSQTRIGKNGRRFKLYKFRSMYADAESRKKELLDQNEVQGPMFKIKNDPRVTKVGRFLRRTSLDELPQFWNILKGDMSLVGTRPPTEDEFEKYNDYYRRRMSITPGLTGLWQVSGRSEVKDFNEVVRMDLQYIDNWSVWQDLRILFLTVGVVLRGSGSR